MARNNYILLACSLFLLASCSGSTTAEEQTTTDSTVNAPLVTDSTTPNPASPASGTDVAQFIQTTMPGWSVPGKEEWEKYWYDRYNKDKNTVFRVQSDFDGNEQRDYAFILKDSAGQYAVWAFMGNDETYSPHRIYDITRLPNRKLHVGLGVLKAGTYNDLNTMDTVPSKVQTDHPAIHVVFFETAAKAYYWKDSTFHLIQTGD